MNENEENFDTLRQLLKLKSFEAPPPGYFNRFSDEVISQLRSGEVEQLSASRTRSEDSWLMKFLQLFEFKPAFAGAFASALCLLLVFGIVYADRPVSQPQPLLQPTSQPTASFAAASPVALGQPAGNTGITMTTNPAISLQPVASLFSQSQNPLAQQVSFTVPGNN
jgi:hypothetical protein